MIRMVPIFLILWLSSSTAVSQKIADLDTALWQAKVRTLPSYDEPASRWEKSFDRSKRNGSIRKAGDKVVVTDAPPSRRFAVPRWVSWLIRFLMIGLVVTLLYLLFKNIRIQRNVKLAASGEEEPNPESALIAFTEPWFLDQIAMAKVDGNNNLVIRYQFLYALWLLNEKHLVSWRKDKTNSNYAKELRIHPDVQNEFVDIAHFYEMIWYGGYNVPLPHWSRRMHKSEAFIQSIISSSRNA